MAVNRDKPDLWKKDIAQSVDWYNAWFMEVAPEAYRSARQQATVAVQEALELTHHLTQVSPALLQQHPGILPVLRMSTCPPLARDRLVGLSGLPKSLVETMDKHGRLPRRMGAESLLRHLATIGRIIEQLADHDIFPWLTDGQPPSEADVARAASIVADRRCGAAADPIVRNAQETRQLQAIRLWLERRGYDRLAAGHGTAFDAMTPGTYGFRLVVPGLREDGRTVKIPVDAVVMPKQAQKGELPLLIEAKSAGDFTNPNKRRKEEAQKVAQLRAAHGQQVRFILFLCGYFDSGYLGYEAAEGIDWVWEHRMDDLALFGLDA